MRKKLIMIKYLNTVDIEKEKELLVGVHDFLGVGETALAALCLCLRDFRLVAVQCIW